MENLISAIQAHKKYKENNTIFLDVRTSAEFDTNHIEGSYNIPLDKLEQHKKDISNLNKDIIIICKSGNRASKACELLNSISNKKYQILEGGITSWIQHEYEIKSGKQKWELERQVRLVAGFLVFLGVILAYSLNFNFILISGFVGAGLMFAAITNTCAMGMLISKLPYNKGTDYKKELKNLF